MTDEQARIQELERTYHSIYSRQESFETFARANIAHIQAQIERQDERMDRLESKMDSQFRSLMIGSGIGFLGVIVTILASK